MRYLDLVLYANSDQFLFLSYIALTCVIVHLSWIKPNVLVGGTRNACCTEFFSSIICCWLSAPMLFKESNIFNWNPGDFRTVWFAETYIDWWTLLSGQKAADKQDTVWTKCNIDIKHSLHTIRRNTCRNGWACKCMQILYMHLKGGLTYSSGDFCDCERFL